MKLYNLNILIFCLLMISCGPKTVYKVEDNNFKDPKQIKLVQVREIISGDTIRLEDGRIIKYFGVEAPKYGEAYFEIAREANKKLIKSGLVMLNQDKFTQDSYYVYTPRIGKIYCFVNQELIQFGCVKVTRSAHKYLKKFILLEEYAKKNKKGIWENN